ncbi:MAG: hypothetical protein ACTSWK_00390 [Promethearchaeota archaeon]
MRKINLNKLAKEVTLLEGGKINMSIGQVKEVMKIIFTLLANGYSAAQIMEVLERYIK